MVDTTVKVVDEGNPQGCDSTTSVHMQHEAHISVGSNMTNELKEINLAFKGISSLVEEVLVQNKALNSRIDGLVVTIENIQHDQEKMKKPVSTSGVTELTPNENMSTATDGSEDVGMEEHNPTRGKKPVNPGGRSESENHNTPSFSWGNRFSSPQVQSKQPSMGPNPTQCLVSAFRKTAACEGKNLFPSPTTTESTPKMPNIDLRSTPSKAGNSSSKGKRTCTSSGKETMAETPATKKPIVIAGLVLPGGMESLFYPTKKMLLMKSELKLAAYVYNPHLDSNEVLMRIGNKIVTRKDFKCLCPEYQVSEEIITLMTMKTTYLQRDAITPTIWSLPPSFVADVFHGLTINELKDNYAKVWMPPYEYLKFVFVPIRDERGHWLLMVISLTDKAVYHVDSHLEHTEDIIKRREIITTVCATISDMVLTDGTYPILLAKNAKQFKTWPIADTTGIPNCGTSEDSAVWVLDWLMQEEGFHKNMYGKIKKKAVRMHTMLTLITGAHNEERREIEEKFEAFWHLHTIGMH